MGWEARYPLAEKAVRALSEAHARAPAGRSRWLLGAVVPGPGAMVPCGLPPA